MDIQEVGQPSVVGSVSTLVLAPIGRMLTDRQLLTAHLSCVISSPLLCPAQIPMSSMEGHSTVLSVSTLAQHLIPLRTEPPSPLPQSRKLRRRSSPFSSTVLSLQSKERVGTPCWRLPSIAGWSVSSPSDGVNGDPSPFFVSSLAPQILAQDFFMSGGIFRSSYAGIPLFIFHIFYLFPIQTTPLVIESCFHPPGTCIFNGNSEITLRSSSSPHAHGSPRSLLFTPSRSCSIV